MKILTKRQVDEILKRLVANAVISIECSPNDPEAMGKATENRAEIAYIVGGIEGIEKVKNTICKIEKRRVNDDK